MGINDFRRCTAATIFLLCALPLCLCRQTHGQANTDSSVLLGVPEGSAVGASAQKTSGENCDDFRPRGALSRPRNGLRTSDLDSAWAAYEATLEKAVQFSRDAIEKKLEVYVTKGDLQAVDKWRQIKNRFEDSGDWPKDEELESVANYVGNSVPRALKNLERAYAAAVRDFTRASDFDQARAFQHEWDQVVLASKTMKAGRIKPDHEIPKRDKAVVVSRATFGTGAAAVDVTKEVQEFAADPKRVITVHSTDFRKKNRKAHFRDKVVIEYKVDGVAKSLTIRNGTKVNLYEALRAD